MSTSTRKQASKRYEYFSEEDKEKLVEDGASDVELTKRDVTRKARKIFCRIHSQVCTD